MGFNSGFKGLNHAFPPYLLVDAYLYRVTYGPKVLEIHAEKLSLTVRSVS